MKRKFRHMHHSIYTKTIVAIFLLVSLFSIMGFLFFFTKEKARIEKNFKDSSKKLANTIKRSLYNAMMKNDPSEISDIIEAISEQEQIREIFIVDKSGKIRFSSNASTLGSSIKITDPTCSVCHNKSPKITDESIFYSKGDEKFLRTVIPIENHKRCFSCHNSKTEVLGVLVTDTSPSSFYLQLRAASKALILSILVLFLAFLALIFTVFNKLIFKPLHELVSATRKITNGELNFRLNCGGNDEIGELASSFNQMIESIKDSKSKLEKLVSELKVKNRELLTLYSATRKITSSMEIEELIKTIFHVTEEIFKTDFCCLLLFHPLRKYATISLKKDGEINLFIFKIPMPKPTKRIDHKFEDPYSVLKEGIRTVLKREIKELGKDLRRESGFLSRFLEVKGKQIGVLTIGKKRDKDFLPVEMRVFEHLCTTISISLFNSIIYGMAITDSLTKLFSRAYFERHLESELERAKRISSSISVALIDVDEFKKFNDLYGHLVGDRVLMDVAKLIKENIRTMDVACRFGGDEFAILFPDADPDQAKIVIDRIKKSLKDYKIKKDGLYVKIPITLSAGISCFPLDSKDAHSLIQNADKALYRAKNSGKDRCFRYNGDLRRDGTTKTHSNFIKQFITKSIEGFAVDSFIRAIKSNGYETYEHCKRVTNYALMFGKLLGLTREEMGTLKVAALLHDIGKVGIRDDLLNKPGPLTEEEFSEIKNHTVLGKEIIKGVVTILNNSLSGIYQHHERWDGKGYPLGIEGEKISLIARIISICDALDAMLSYRPYRDRALTLQEAIEELEKNAGTQFDPEIVEKFLKDGVGIKHTKRRPIGFLRR